MVNLRNRSVWEGKARTLIEVAVTFRAPQREACMAASENVFNVQAQVMKSTPDLEAQVELRAGAGVLRNARTSGITFLHGARLSSGGRPDTRDSQQLELSSPQTLRRGEGCHCSCSTETGMYGHSCLPDTGPVMRVTAIRVQASVLTVHGS